MSLGYLESKKVPFNCEGLQLVWTDILVHYRFYDILRFVKYWLISDGRSDGSISTRCKKVMHVRFCPSSEEWGFVYILLSRLRHWPHHIRSVGRVNGKGIGYFAESWISVQCPNGCWMELRSKVLLRKLIISPLKNDLFGLKKTLIRSTISAEP